MSMENIRKQYRVPAKRGATVRYTGDFGPAHDGVIVGTVGAYLRVRFPTRLGGQVQTIHPTWKLEYLGDDA